MNGLLLAVSLFIISVISAQTKPYKVIAYYSGDSTSLHQYDFSKMTHLIYGFAHVKDGNLVINHKKDTAVLLAFQKIKKQYPGLKTLIALGGWGGCEFCSQTFNDAELTRKFARSSKDFIAKYKMDGIDLDWEYPTIKGNPGHQFIPEDRDNFTRLVAELRKTLGPNKLVTFAAGGFQEYLDKSVDWKAIEKNIDFVNLMTYDLVHGYSTQTGHHTPLYSSRPGEESTDNAVRFFEKINFPLKKVIVGAAFYSREFANVENINNGLYQPTTFLDFIDYKVARNKHTKENGYVYHWDNTTKSPYWYNAEKKVFVTGEDRSSLHFKCDYIKRKKLGGIMFWELFTDTPEDGLLRAINMQ